MFFLTSSSMWHWEAGRETRFSLKKKATQRRETERERKSKKIDARFVQRDNPIKIYMRYILKGKRRKLLGVQW